MFNRCNRCSGGVS